MTKVAECKLLNFNISSQMHNNAGASFHLQIQDKQ